MIRGTVNRFVWRSIIDFMYVCGHILFCQELLSGTKVLVENTKQKERKGGKLDNKYTGPYIIHNTDGKGVYTLKTLDGKVLKNKCNMKRLKVY